MAYQLLATREFTQQLDWGKIHLFWSDERCVAPEDPRSNYRAAAETLLPHISIPMQNIHRMRGDTDPETAAREYEALLPDRLDLIWLGLGENGHIASLFPNQPALLETTRRVLAVGVQAEVAERLTLTLPTLNASREIQLIVTGARKAEILKSVLSGPRDPEHFPAQLLAPVGKLTWLVDKAAAARWKDVRVE